MTFSDALETFVREHENDDTSAIVLSRGKYPGIDVNLAAECILARRKLRGKCPHWAAAGILCPSALSAEQCSSEQTASYKASLLPLRGRAVADLTAGLGVDCAAFARVAARVLYNEMNPLLAEAARRNFATLGIDNVSFSCLRITPETLRGIVSDFRPDVIFLDPARRGSDGGKLFRLEDCSPKLPELLPLPVEALVKVSPMADITHLRRQIGPGLSAIHVIGSGGECKELLLHLVPGFGGETEIIAGEIRFTPSEEALSNQTLCGRVPSEGDWIFEPDRTLAKAGCPRLLCSRYALRRLGSEVPFYTADEKVSALEAHGRWSRVVETMPFSKRNAVEMARRHPDSELLCRALRISTDELRRHLALSGGDSKRILALGSDSIGKQLILVRRQ